MGQMGGRQSLGRPKDRKFYSLLLKAFPVPGRSTARRLAALQQPPVERDRQLPVSLISFAASFEVRSVSCEYEHSEAKHAHLLFCATRLKNRRDWSELSDQWALGPVQSKALWGRTKCSAGRTTAYARCSCGQQVFPDRPPF